MAQVEVEHLTKHYGAFAAVSDLSFALDAGKVLGFLGPNGAGKTTTMRILAGYLPATGGRARIAGHDVLAESLAARRKIGYLPESVPLYPEMTCLEYLRYQAKLKDVPRAQLAGRLDYVLDGCGVREYRRKLIRALSKGMRQRLGLAATLIHDPEVVILDEPTIGLDPNQIIEIRSLIHRLGGTRTVIISTHILSEVESVCNTVLIIHRGRRLLFDDLTTITGDASSGPRLRLEVEGPLEAIAGRLGALPGVSLSERVLAGGPVRFRITGPPRADARALRRAVAQAVAEAGGTLLELYQETTSLEEIFRRLTREAEEAAATAALPAPATAR